MCWSSILNRDHLIGHSRFKLREAAVDIIEHGIRAANPYKATLDLLKLQGDILRVGPVQFDLTQWDSIYVVGAGKATQPIAQALEEVLGERITAGLVALKRGEAHCLSRISIVDAAHPIPDEKSFQAGQEVVKIAQRAGPRDIVFSVMTGGSSALLILPPAGITVADKQALNKLLLECGASIREINAVRKHVSRIKGGRLALDIFPAELINLTVSDVVGDPVDYITDLTVPDTSTHLDACRTLDKYDLWNRLPISIRRHLERGPDIETPKTFTSNPHTFIVVPGDAACQGAARRAKELGFATTIFTTKMEGESCEEAAVFAGLVDAVGQNIRSETPRAILACGETTVTICGSGGEGGPSQEFALAGALSVADRGNIVISSVDTDGTDGPTDASGGLVDGFTVSRATEAGLSSIEALKNHAAREVLEATGDLVITGPTGTNVGDLMLLLTGG